MVGRGGRWKRIRVRRAVVAVSLESFDEIVVGAHPVELEVALAARGVPNPKHGDPTVAGVTVRPTVNDLRHGHRVAGVLFLRRVHRDEKHVERAVQPAAVDASRIRTNVAVFADTPELHFVGCAPVERAPGHAGSLFPRRPMGG